MSASAASAGRPDDALPAPLAAEAPRRNRTSPRVVMRVHVHAYWANATPIPQSILAQWQKGACKMDRLENLDLPSADTEKVKAALPVSHIHAVVSASFTLSWIWQ